MKMGKLEEFTKISEEFARARKGIEVLANEAHRGWRRPKWGKEDYGCFRILSRPEDEIDRWEEKGGYITKESMWGRFPCTANKYLPWMMKQEIVPPWLRDPEVMFEVEKGWKIECLKYSEAAVGSYPIKRTHMPGAECYCEPAHDVYVSNEDLILSECWSYEDIKIEHVKRVFIDPDARTEVREKAEAFAKRHDIPITYGFPDPEVDMEHEEWLKKNYPPEKAEEEIKWWRGSRYRTVKEPLLDLIKYLKERHEKCWDVHLPPRDVAAAALAEAYDKVMHRITPIGASDAILEMVELGKREPMLSPVFGIGPPAEACLRPWNKEELAESFEKAKERLG